LREVKERAAGGMQQNQIVKNSNGGMKNYQKIGVPGYRVVK